jgi:hypothetical protein
LFVFIVGQPNCEVAMKLEGFERCVVLESGDECKSSSALILNLVVPLWKAILSSDVFSCSMAAIPIRKAERQDSSTSVSK